MRKESGSHDEQDIRKAEEQTKKEKKSKKEKETQKEEKREKKEMDKKDKKETDKKEKKEKKETDKRDKKEKEKKETDKKEKKSKKEKKEKDADRGKKEIKPKESTSSFEAGALSPARSSSPPPPLEHLNKPASFSNTIREGSRTLSKKVASSAWTSPLRCGCLPRGAGRPRRLVCGPKPAGSTPRAGIHSTRRAKGVSEVWDFSAGSSLRPLSTISNHSRTLTTSGASTSTHSSHTGCSVRWDEEGLETVRKTTRREQAERAKDENKDEKERKRDVKESHESRRPLESRKRTAITDIFPNIGSRRSSISDEAGSLVNRQLPVQGPPSLTVEAATGDGQSAPNYDGPLDDMSNVGTPSKRARPRPMSKQPLGKSRLSGVYHDDDGMPPFPFLILFMMLMPR